jgi:hypothetical protein
MTVLKLTSWVVGHKSIKFGAKKYFPVQSGSETVFGHFKLELRETQCNVAIELW